MEKKILPFDPDFDQVIESVIFVPGDKVTIMIDAKSCGCVFITKNISPDPVITVHRD